MKHASRRMRRLAQRTALIPIPSGVSRALPTGRKLRYPGSGHSGPDGCSGRPAFGPDLELLRHELRTPLAGIMGLAELLGTSGLSARAACWLSTLQACGLQMAGLIDRTLKAPDEVRADERRAPVDGQRFLESLIAAHWPAARAGDIQLLLVCGAGAQGAWHTDEVVLRQAMDNLLANAIRFSGGGRVVLEARVASRAGSTWNVLELAVENRPLKRQTTLSNLQETGEFADRVYGMRRRGRGLQVVEAACRQLGGRLLQCRHDDGSRRFALLLEGVIRHVERPPAPFIPALLRQAGCILLLEAAQERSILAMLAHLEIPCTVIETEHLPRLESWPPSWILIASVNRLPAAYCVPGAHRASNAIAVLARVQGLNGPRLASFVLAEPLFLADLQNILLRCRIEQELAAGHPPGQNSGCADDGQA